MKIKFGSFEFEVDQWLMLFFGILAFLVVLVCLCNAYVWK